MIVALTDFECCVSNTTDEDKEEQAQVVILDSVTLSNLKLSWSGDYQCLKNFVKDKLNMS